jgi:DNA mismatch repair protein MutS2
MEIAPKSRKSLEFDKILDKLSNFAKIEQSKVLCKNLTPFNDIVEINHELQCTREAKFILDIPNDIPIEFVADISKLNVLTSYLAEDELIDVAKTLKTSRLVKNFLSNNLEDDAILKKMAQNLLSDKLLEDKIFDTFDENLNIKQDATPELKGLYSALRDNEKNLRTTVSNLLNSSEFSKHLQENIYTTRDDRIVFQVMASSKSKVAGIVHDVSATNKTFYIEPAQIVPLNNKIREIKSQIHSEIIKILTGLTNLVKDDIKALSLSEEILAKIDFHFAKARYAVKLKAVEPEIVTHKILEFENMKHPLLNVENIVTNNFEIGKDYKSVVITGSNTGGKTVTIKTIGLFILMAKAGMFLPCTGAKVYPFENIFADIGDDQSIQQNLSTFSSHMTNIIEILKLSDNKTFVILDEICAGTDPVEGAVLAQVILEKLAQKEVISTITTHYGELKTLEYSNPYFKNASVEFNTDTLKPTYKLLIGIPGLSNAISIATNLGLDIDLAKKAKDIIISTKDPSIAVVEKLQETQAKLTQNLEEAENLKESSQNLKIEYETSLQAVKKDKKKTVKNIKDKFDRELLSVKAEIKDILEELRKEKSEKIARRSYARLAQMEQKFRGKLSEYDEKQHYEDIDWNCVKEGDKLILKELNQPVVLLSLPDKNKYATVQMGNIKTKIKCNKLAPYDSAYEKKQNVYKPSSFESFELRRVNVSNTLDLRGLKVEDALDELENYLDKASLANLACVTVIHGHGTGALKSAVRDFLSTSPYVAKYRAGEDAEGGDGVSVIDIN